MQYNQPNQPYGQISGNQDYYYPQQYPPANQQSYAYPPQPQQGYVPPYLDPNVPVGQPIQPQYGMQPMQPMAQQPYIMGGPIAMTPAVLQSAEGLSFPAQILCPYCQKSVVTRIEHRVGDGTICASLLVLLLCWPLFWLPCCLQDCQDRVHFCPSCQKIVGRKRYEVC